MSAVIRRFEWRAPHWWRPLILLAAGILLLAFWSVLMLVVAICTAFRMRRLYSEVLGKWLGQVGLSLCGIRLELHGPRPCAGTQTIYLANHTSTLDLFILLALGLPQTRFFLKRKYRMVPPLAIIGYLLGVFFTPPQTDRGKRVRCFQHAESVLRQTGDSIFLSPEGTRITSGEIGRFNKGAFHLATNLHAPIVPIFIAIPKDINPGRGFSVRAGVVHVHFQPAVSTESWKLDDLERNKTAIRAQFVALNRSLRLQ